MMMMVVSRAGGWAPHPQFPAGDVGVTSHGRLLVQHNDSRQRCTSPGEMSALGEKEVGVVACSRTPLASYTCMARLSLYAGPSKGGPLQGRSLNIAEPRPSVCSGRREWRRPSRQHPKSQTAIACVSVRRWRHAGSPLLDGFKFGDGPRRKRSIEGFWKTGLRGEGEWLEWMDGQNGRC